MTGVMLVSAMIVSAALMLALQPTYLGLSLVPDFKQNRILIQSVDPQGPAQQLLGSSVLKALDGLLLCAEDLVQVPDQVGSFDAIKAFMDRQSSLADPARSSPIVVTAEDASGNLKQIEITPAAKSLKDLPAAFWVQVGFGFVSLLIACWVWALRPADLAAKVLALTGMSLFLTIVSTAIYSTRELALEGTTFHVLFLLSNFTCAAFNSLATILFFIYPRQLIHPSKLWLLPAAATAWFILDSLHAFPAATHSIRYVHVVSTVLILGAIVAQWRASLGHPVERAAIICLGSSFVVALGTYFVGFLMPLLFGSTSALGQEYSFVTLLPLFAGIALGVARYRLFELGEWAFRLIFYTVGILLLLLLDALLIIGLQVGQGLSLGLSLLLIGFAYLPMRE